MTKICRKLSLNVKGHSQFKICAKRNTFRHQEIIDKDVVKKKYNKLPEFLHLANYNKTISDNSYNKGRALKWWRNRVNELTSDLVVKISYSSVFNRSYGGRRRSIAGKSFYRFPTLFSIRLVHERRKSWHPRYLPGFSCCAVS